MEKITPSRLLHVMLRVKSLDKSIAFYTQLLGMKLLRKKDYPTGRFTLAFLGFGDETVATALELTYNWDTKSFSQGNAFGHLAFAVNDLYALCNNLTANQVEFKKQPSPMRFEPEEIIAFVTDPDGYTIEIIEKA